MGKYEMTKLPDSNIEIEKAPDEFRQALFSFLKSDGSVKKMTFPRLRFPRLHRLGYLAEDYETIADKIDSGAIEVYQTKVEQTAFKGTYNSTSKSNFFAFTPQVSASLTAYASTIVHEATHAIQDLKEWKMSPLENEVDAHFAEAFYLILSGREKEANSNTRMTYFMLTAQWFFEDSDYLATAHFRGKQKDLDNSVRIDYRYKQEEINPNFDANKFNKEFEKRVRWDGISG